MQDVRGPVEAKAAKLIGLHKPTGTFRRLDHLKLKTPFACNEACAKPRDAGTHDESPGEIATSHGGDEDMRAPWAVEAGGRRQRS